MSNASVSKWTVEPAKLLASAVYNHGLRAGGPGKCGAMEYDMTPAMAKEIVERPALRNRTLNEGYVRKLANAMADGKWRLNGETVVLTKEGYLVDGQHRLNAVCLSGATVPMLLAVVDDVGVFETIDSGRARTNTDVLTIAGESHATRIGAALIQIDCYYSGVTFNSKYGSHKQPILELLRRYPLIREQVARVSKHCRSAKLLTPSVADSTRYIFERIDRQSADCFFGYLDYDPNDLGARWGYLAVDYPAVASGKIVLENNAMAKAKLQKGILFDLCVQMWNAMMQGDRRKKYKWNLKGGTTRAVGRDGVAIDEKKIDHTGGNS